MKKILALAALSVAATSGAFAQAFPSKPITLVVPFAAGGPTDLVARRLAEAMRKPLGGANIVVENAAGAGGTIGATKVARAAPDGYTLLVWHIGMAATTSLYRKQTFKPLEDFDYLGAINDVPMTLLGTNKLNANTYRDFEAYIRANMNALPALIAATQKPRDLTRQDLKDLATALDENGFSEASLRRAYGTARNADIAAHILGFVRQAALGDPLVPYATRVENGVQKILASRNWTPKQTQWLNRIGRALKDQPVGDPALLSDPLFAQQGGFDVINQTFDSGLGDVLKDLNAAIWSDGSEGGRAA